MKIRAWKNQERASIFTSIFMLFYLKILQCFDAVGWAAGRASGL